MNKYVKFNDLAEVTKWGKNDSIFFCFTDSDYEEHFFTYKGMKEFAKENYRPKDRNVYFGAFYYSDYCRGTEPIDAIKITRSTNTQNLVDFKKMVIQFMAQR